MPQFVKNDEIFCWIITVLLIGLFSVAAYAAPREHSEKYYQEKYCMGEIEVRNPDKTRTDCIYDGFAWEYDFANKWYEAPTQAKWYAIQTGLKAGVVLIIEKKSDCLYVRKLRLLLNHYAEPVRVETVGLVCSKV